MIRKPISIQRKKVGKCDLAPDQGRCPPHPKSLSHASGSPLRGARDLKGSFTVRYPEGSQKPVGSNSTGFCMIAMRDLRLACRWVNYGSDLQDAVSGESAAPCVLPDHVLVG